MLMNMKGVGSDEPADFRICGTADKKRQGMPTKEVEALEKVCVPHFYDAALTFTLVHQYMLAMNTKRNTIAFMFCCHKAVSYFVDKCTTPIYFMG
jgi:hypothetical protein